MENMFIVHLDEKATSLKHVILNTIPYQISGFASATTDGSILTIKMSTMWKGAEYQIVEFFAKLGLEKPRIETK